MYSMNTPAIVEQLAASANDDKLYVAFFQDLSIGLNGSANPLAIDLISLPKR